MSQSDANCSPPGIRCYTGKKQGANPISRFPLPPSTQKSSNYKSLAGQFPIQPNREFSRPNREAWAGNRDLCEVIREQVFRQGPVDAFRGKLLCVPVKRTP